MCGIQLFRKRDPFAGKHKENVTESDFRVI